jgi:molybdopterin/thiamine biosynthesis adenylyltransferase
MALAEYFERNAQAAAALVQGFDASLLGARLESEVIGVAFDGSAERSSEGQAGLDLCLRLLSRLYPKLAIVGLPGSKPATLRKLRALARDINPGIELESHFSNSTKLLVFGNTRVTGNRKAKDHIWYVGSDNWIAKLSTAAPVGSGSSNNPLAAGAAACIAAANVFRAVFVQELGQAALDTEVATSLLDLRPGSAGTANPRLSPVRFDDVHLVGAGAIGNGVLWALSRMDCEGTLHVVDPEAVTDSNLQRYVMLTAGDRTKKKAELAKSWLESFGPALKVKPHVATWSEHVATRPEYKVQTVLSAVDSARARIEIQASLPRYILNGWTQRGEAGVSRHNFLSGLACLACLYLPSGQAPSEDLIIARALRLGEDEPTVREVRRRLVLKVPTERAFLEQIANAAGMEIQKLLSFENRLLRDLYVEGVCGGAVMEFHDAALKVKAEVPMGFQSALSGILLAAELARPAPLATNVTQIDLLSTFPERPGHNRAKTTAPPCICQDQDFLDVFKSKYGIET